MGMVVRVEAYVPENINPARAFRAAFDRVGDLARTLSSYRDDSEVRRVEREAWRSHVPISADLAAVLGRALELARQSEGAFDPTLGRVTELVRARGGGQAGPEPAVLEDARKLTGWQHVELDQASRTVFLGLRGLQIDLGGAAKGFIADEALKSLRQAGISHALVSVAGDIAAGAAPPGAVGWRVAIDQTGPRGDSEVQLLLQDQAVSTSGGRERYFHTGGQKCSHILAGNDGRCVDVSTAVSVVASSGLEADGLATALVALGRARSAALLSRYPHVQVYWSSELQPSSQTAHQRMPSTESQR